MVDGGWWLTSGLSQTECGQTQTKGGGECIRGDREGMMKREREREGIMKSETGRERGKEKERQRTRKKKKHTKRNSLRQRFSVKVNAIYH